MKKYFYIVSFTFLGFLLQLLIHALIENGYIYLLTTDFSTYSLGLSWAQWFTIHHVGTIVMALGGLAFGFWQGRYWWHRLYEKTN